MKYRAYLLPPAAPKTTHLPGWRQQQLFAGKVFEADDLRDAADFYTQYMHRVHRVPLSLTSGEFAIVTTDVDGAALVA